MRFGDDPDCYFANFSVYDFAHRPWQNDTLAKQYFGILENMILYVGTLAKSITLLQNDLVQTLPKAEKKSLQNLIQVTVGGFCFF